MSLDIEPSVVFKRAKWRPVTSQKVPNKSCKISVFLLSWSSLLPKLHVTLYTYMKSSYHQNCSLLSDPKKWLFHHLSLHHLFPGQLLRSQWNVFSLSGHSLALAPASFVGTWYSAASCEDYCKCSFVENKIALVETNIFTFWESQINNVSLNTINTFRLDF